MITKPSYVADFETITRDGVEQVWLYDICNLKNLEHNIGTNIEDFINFIDNLEYASRVYFHNLKFDGSFLIDYFLKNGYELIKDDNRRIKKNTFTLLVTEFGQFFKITYKNKHGKQVELIDSLKVLQLSVDKLAKDFKLPILKGSIDYNKKRDYEYVPTSKEIEYVKHDTEIVARCLQIFIEQGHDKLTLSSCAFSEYKSIIGKNKYSNWFGGWEKKCDLILDREIREAYRGGFCQPNINFINKTIKSPVWYNDVNSLYPFVMSTYDLPYGEPIEFDGKYETDKEFPYYVQKIKVNMCLRENGIPCILNKSKGVDCNYIVDTQENTSCGSLIELTLTNFDLELMFENYEIFDIKYCGGYKFRVRNDMFIDYINKFYEMKETATIEGNGALRCIAKLFLNSLYGKFGQNPERRRKLPYIDLENKVKFYKTEKTISKKFNYLPVAVFITALARYKVINDIMKIGIENWVYTDTDSILSLTPFPSEMVDNKKLGKYKVEQIFKKCRVLGPKTYYGINTRNQITAKACGCNKKALENFPIGKFNFGETVKNGRTTLKTVDGGKKIDFADFTFRDKTKYYKIWKENNVTCCLITKGKFKKLCKH